jgi:hypothetical protein
MGRGEHFNCPAPKCSHRVREARWPPNETQQIHSQLPGILRRKVSLMLLDELTASNALHAMQTISRSGGDVERSLTSENAILYRVL